MSCCCSTICMLYITTKPMFRLQWKLNWSWLCCYYCRQMSWNTLLKGWWMDLLTHGKLPDLASAWLSDKWVDTKGGFIPMPSPVYWSTFRIFAPKQSLLTRVFSAYIHICLSSSALTLIDPWRIINVLMAWNWFCLSGVKCLWRRDSTEYTQQNQRKAQSADGEKGELFYHTDLCLFKYIVLELFGIC